jgi:hypothetical protein
MKKIAIIILGFLIGFVVFMPKKELFFFFQKVLDQKNIKIISTTSQTPIQLNLLNTKVFYSNIKTASIKEVNIYPLLLINIIKARNIKFDIGNIQIKNLTAYFTLYPKIFVKGDGNIGEFEGWLSLKEAKIYIKNPSFQIKPFLKRDKKGYFYYEKF